MISSGGVSTNVSSTCWLGMKECFTDLFELCHLLQVIMLMELRLHLMDTRKPGWLHRAKQNRIDFEFRPKWLHDSSTNGNFLGLLK